MRSMRHPNPLIDVRRARHREKAGVNPPGFIWKPIEGVERYTLEICRDRKFEGPTLRRWQVTGRTIFIPDEPLEPGRWHWRWSTDSKRGPAFLFEILPDAAEVRIGDIAGRAGDHPRMMVRAQDVASLRLRMKDDSRLAPIVARADALLAEPHELEEPPFLPNRSEDYNAAHVIWRRAMNDSRRFAAGAQDLGYAFLLSGDRRYGEAAAQRLDSLSRWNPDGSTTIQHNDEPHMSVINWCPFAFDWAFETIGDAQRERIVAHLARRADNTLAHLEELNYPLNPVSNHAGRMLGFLGNCALALAGHHPNAQAWLRYVLEIMASMYPAWGGDAGGWAQGFSYGGAYVRWILEFIASARSALDMDFYRKPFFRNHAKWYLLCLPEWAWQNPFCDGGEREFPKLNAALIAAHLGAILGDGAASDYASRCMAEADRQGEGGALFGREKPIAARPPVRTDPLILLAEHNGAGERRRRTLPKAERFDDIGWVGMRRNFDDPEDDISLVLKSSPYGPVSHSHGDQNCFVLSAFGKPMLIRTGQYVGYGSPHHQNWIRQTKAHNGLTAGGVGQWVNDFDAVGRIVSFKRAKDFAYACGDASGAYGERVDFFRRHVLFVGWRYFVIVDELSSRISQTYEWHLHSIERMEVDQDAKRVRVAREGATLDVSFLTASDMRFYQTDAYDVPNDDPERHDDVRPWHLRAATVPVRRSARVGMLLVPNREANPDAFQVERGPVDGAFRTTVRHADGTDEFLIAVGDAPIPFAGETRSVLFLWSRSGELKLEVPQA